MHFGFANAAHLRTRLILAVLLAWVGLPAGHAADRFPTSPALPDYTQVVCADCPPVLVVDAQKALDDGLRTYKRGLSDGSARILGDAVMFFRHGFAQSRDSIFLLHEADIDRRGGICSEGISVYEAFMKLETKQKRFPAEAKRLKDEFTAFRKECAWQGVNAPTVVEKRLKAFVKAQAGKTMTIRRTPADGRLHVQCGLAANCDQTGPYRMFGLRDPGLQITAFFDASIVGKEDEIDVSAAFQYLDFVVRLPDLGSITWGIRGDSFNFLMRKGDPRIRSITYKDGILRITATADLTDLQAESSVDPCIVTPHPKACLMHVPAKIPLEFDLTLPIERGPVNCKEKNLPDRVYRCG